jgi:hypothetical protein
MSQSYQSKDSAVQQVQLKVQHLSLKMSDNQVVSTSGVTATIDLQEPIGEIRSAIFIDDSAGTAAPVAAANRAVSGNQVVLTLSAAMAAADCIELSYVISE